MKYRIEVLSPLHIGNGNEISPIEYIMEEKFYRIDMESLFKDDGFDVNGFIEDTKLYSFYLGDKYSHIAKKHILYSMEISKDVKQKGRIKEFIKTGGKPYVPGSSIKGAIRTALLWYTLKNDEGFHEKMEDYLDRVIRGEKKPEKKYVDNEIEKMIFGKDPNHDVLRFLHVSDSDNVGYNKMRVENVKVISKRKMGYETKFNTPVETMKTGVSLKSLNIEIKIDKSIEDEKVKDELKLNETVLEAINRLEEVCKEYAKDLIHYEFEFFSSCNNNGSLDEIIDYYGKLYDLAEKNILLHISWGSGWQSMTVGREVGEEKIDELRLIYNLGKIIHKGCGGNVIKDRRNRGKWFCKKCKRGNLGKEDIEIVKPFPKTRKIVFENGKPKYPLGWIKLEEIK